MEQARGPRIRAKQAALLACTLAAAATWAGKDTPIPRADLPAERVETRRVRVPVILDERSAGGCDGMTADAIAVLEDGRPSPALHFEPNRLRAVHAVLVDAGPEMLDGLHRLRAAAASYARGLPPDEPALLATFDDQLRLHCSLATERGRFEASLEWIETGGASHLWSSLRQLIDYLGPLPQRKVLLLITDGCDSRTDGPDSADAVIELATRTESLIVFVIGVHVPAKCGKAGPDPRFALKSLARRTGGDFHESEPGSRLAALFGGVRERLDREQYVTYEPIPFGDGPKDRPQKENHRWREVGVRLVTQRACEISLTGSPVRLEAAVRSGATDATGFLLESDRGHVTGRVRDLVADIAVTPSVVQFVAPGAPARSDERFETRGLRVPLPSLEEVVRPDARPEDPVLYALARQARFHDLESPSPVAPGGAGGWSSVPFLVHGSTLLDSRAAMAGALAGHPDFARWAKDRIRNERVAELDELIRISDTPGERDVLRQARTILAGDDWNPTERELERRLGGWLGDVTVARVFNAADAWLAQRLIDAAGGAGGPDALSRAVAEVERLQRVLAGWLPPPEEVSLLGVLIPGYDPLQDVVGYYRVILSQPYSARIAATLVDADAQAFVGGTAHGGPGEQDTALYRHLQSFNHSRGAPLGARLVGWMLRQPEVAARVAGTLDVAAVHYAHPRDRDLLPTLVAAHLAERRYEAEVRSARQATIVLAARQAPEQRVSVSAYFEHEPGPSGGYGIEPFCLMVPPDPPPALDERALWTGLVTAMLRSDPPCILRRPPEE